MTSSLWRRHERSSGSSYGGTTSSGCWSGSSTDHRWKSGVVRSGGRVSRKFLCPRNRVRYSRSIILLLSLFPFSLLHAIQRFPTLQKYYVGEIPCLYEWTDRPTRELRFSDMNGDTLEDIFVINNKDSSYFSVLYGNGDGTFNANEEIYHSGRGESGKVNYLLIDAGNNGLDDVLQSMDKWDLDFLLSFNNGTTSWVGGRFYLSYDIALHYLIGVCDCDHDGRDEFIGQNYEPYGADILILRDELGIAEYDLYRSIPHYDYTKLYPLGDYSGDGWTDFLVSSGMNFGLLFEYQGSGSCQFSLNQTYSFGAGLWRLERGDFNGDDIDDIVYNGEWHPYYYVAYGSTDGLDFGNQRQYQWLSGPGYELATGYMVVGNVNGDGLDDVGVVDRRCCETEHELPVYFHVSAGDTFLADCDTLILPSDRNSCVYSRDLNGDGFADLFYFRMIDTVGVLINWGPNETFLRRFEARFDDGVGVVLNWEVIDTEDCDRLTVVRSTGAGDSGFSCEIQAERERCEYEYIDADALSRAGSTLHYRLEVREKYGSTRLLATESVSVPAVPLRLHQNYPNPFNPGTSIRFDMPAAERVWLDIYDVSGRLVRRLVDGEERGPGPVEVYWDGTSDAGERRASGVYYCRLRVGKETRVRIMVLIQ
jgi:hypothetical protein